MKNTIIILFIGLIVSSASFYGGMKYSESQRPQRFQQAGDMNGGRFGGRMQNGQRLSGEAVGGEILSKDDRSIVLKLRDGGSKIILLSSQTSVGRLATGSLSDINIGANIFINGTSNQDGSLTANSIQIR